MRWIPQGRILGLRRDYYSPLKMRLAPRLSHGQSHLIASTYLENGGMSGEACFHHARHPPPDRIRLYPTFQDLVLLMPQPLMRYRILITIKRPPRGIL